MKLLRKTFDTVLGLCLDGVQVAEASDQDVLDAYAKIPKDVRELDATMRAAKEAGNIVTDEIFREDVVDTWKLRGYFSVDHEPPAMPGTLKDTAAAMDFGVDHVEKAVEKLDEGGGHKVEGPALVSPDLPVLPGCLPGHEDAIRRFQDSLAAIVQQPPKLTPHEYKQAVAAITSGYDIATLRGRVEQLEAREAAWKEKLATLEKRSEVIDRIKDACDRIHLNDEELVTSLAKMHGDALRADRCEEELERKAQRIAELSMQLAALRKELSEANGETRAKLAERRAMWRERCEEAERKYGVLVDGIRAAVGGTEDFGKSIRKMKADLDAAKADLKKLENVAAHAKHLEATLLSVVGDMPESHQRPRDPVHLLHKMKADLAAARARIAELEAASEGEASDKAVEQRDEARKDYHAAVDRALEAHRVLGANHNEGTLEAAKRVVAERDALRGYLAATLARMLTEVGA